MSILGIYFGWPYGNVWANLVASGICAAAVWWRARVHLRRHHAEQLAQRDRHHAEQLEQQKNHHEDLKAHVRRVITGPLIEQMSDVEFDKQLTALMRRNPAVLDTFLRTRARMQGRSFRPGGERTWPC